MYPKSKKLAQELILQALHGDSEVDDWGLGTDFRGVSRVGQLGRDVHHEPGHHIILFVPYYYLVEKDHQVYIQQGIAL